MGLVLDSSSVDGSSIARLPAQVSVTAIHPSSGIRSLWKQNIDTNGRVQNPDGSGPERGLSVIADACVMGKSHFCALCTTGTNWFVSGPSAMFIRDESNKLWLPLTDPTVSTI